MRLEFAILLVIGLAACGPGDDSAIPPPQEQEMPDRPPAVTVIQRHDDAILAIQGVSMIYEGITDAGEPCIKVGVVKSTPELLKVLPRELEGWPVVVVETGKIRPMFEP